MLFFTIPERSDEDEIIDTMISETTMLERTIETVPNIYGLRVFSDNPVVPERWPIFMNSSRTKLASLNRWEFGYTADYLGNLGSLKYESVCSTRRLEKNHREIGYIQIAMKTSDFFPFLFKKISDFNDVNPEMIEALKNNLEINGISDGYEIFNVAFEDLEFGDADLCVIDAFPGVDVEEIVKKAERMAENVIVI